MPPSARTHDHAGLELDLKPRAPGPLGMVARVLAAFAVLAVCSFGIVLPLLVFHRPLSMPSLDTVLLVLCCIVFTTLFGHVRFRFGEAARGHMRGFELAPDTAFIVLAAVMLAPWQAAVVAVIGTFGAMRHERGARLVFELATASTAAGLASLAASAVGDTAAGIAPVPTMVLPAVLVAATVRSLCVLVARTAFEEARTPGGGAAIVRAAPLGALVPIDIGLPVAAISMGGPYLDRPLLAVLVVMPAQGLAWVVLRQLHREWHQRRQNSYLRETVSRFMPEEVVREMLADGRQATLGGEQHEITVMFIDVRHFTAWAEHRDPSEVIAELNTLLSELAQAVLSTDGTIDKFMGDGLMAFWGAPQPRDDHAAQAMRAVPKLLMRAREFNISREARGEPALDIGLGINTGLAMVGNVGHADRLNYTAIGDTVNTAARLEGATREFNCPVLVSEATFLSLPVEMQRQCARLDSVAVKGRRDRVRAYTLTHLARHRADWWRPAA